MKSLLASAYSSAMSSTLRTKRIWALIAIVLAISCKEPFDPKIESAETGYLVVEGYINAGIDNITTIQLSRTGQVSQQGTLVIQNGAHVLIEDDLGNHFPLIEVTPGKYQSAPLTLPLDHQYRLSILVNQKQYYSEYLAPLATPPIDSVVWRRDENGVRIFVNTHDEEDKVNYYRWDYEEVWEIRSAYHTFFEYSNGEILIRPDDEILRLWKCWKYNYPTGFLISSTADFTENRISMRQLIDIPNGKEHLSQDYSVIVYQHALSRQEYEFLQLIERNTTQVGSFFDPQPSELTGNLYCTTSDEPVVGYVGASTTQSQRIFITRLEVPNWGYRIECENIFVGNTRENYEHYFGTMGLIPTNTDGVGSYFGSTPFCTDCSRRGGGHVRPPFW